MATTFITRMFALSAVLCAALFTAPVTPATADVVPQSNGSADTIRIKGPRPGGDLHMQRLGGETRYETALQVAEVTQRLPPFNGRRFRRVVIARGDDYADAIAAAPLARGSYKNEADGPVLLTPSHGLHPKVKQFLTQKVDPNAMIYIMGGHKAIGPEVEHQIRSMRFRVRRFAGINRADTATQAGIHIFEEKTQGEAPKWRWLPVTMADGTNWHESLIASSLATREGGVVLLTYGDHIPEETWVGIRSIFGPMTIIGREASKAKIEGAARVTEATPEALSLLVAKRALTKPKNVGFVTTNDFADALAAAPLLAANGDTHLIFVDHYVSPAVVAWFKANQIKHFFVLGGESRISNETIQRFVLEVNAA